MPATGGDRAPDAPQVKVGDRVPCGHTFYSLQDDGTPTVLSSDDVFAAGKRVVLFAVPGPFTPKCTKVHLPSFQRRASALKRTGSPGRERDTVVACVAVSDAFVMDAWGRHMAKDSAEPGDASPTGSVLMLADPEGAFTRSVGMSQDARASGLGWRCKRYLMVVDDGVVKHVAVDARKLKDTGGEAALAATSKL